MSSLKEVYDLSMAGLQSALVDETAAFQRASLAGDIEEQVRASQAMALLRAQAHEYHAMAVENAAAMRPAVPASKFGLSAAEIDVAHNSFSAPGVSKEDKERLYAENKAKLRQMRADGTYSDGQGSVFK